MMMLMMVTMMVMMVMTMVVVMMSSVLDGLEVIGSWEDLQSQRSEYNIKPKAWVARKWSFDQISSIEESTILSKMYNNSAI